MKVWLLVHGEECGSTDRATFYGVFSSLELAETHMTQSEFLGRMLDDYEIIEAELDAFNPEGERIV